MFGDVFDDDSGSFEGRIRLSVKLFQCFLIEIFRGINVGQPEISGDTFLDGLFVFFVEYKSISFDHCPANSVDRCRVRYGEVLRGLRDLDARIVLAFPGEERGGKLHFMNQADGANYLAVKLFAR